MRNVCFVALLVVGLYSCGNKTTHQGKEAAMYYLKGASHNVFQKNICIIAAGKSNIDGRCFYDEMPTYIKGAMPMANTHYVKNSIEEPFAPINIQEKWAFDLVIYYHIAKTVNKELYVIKWTQGGTSIDALGNSDAHWTADYENLRGGGYFLTAKI